jgi:hypothetical protein
MRALGALLTLAMLAATAQALTAKDGCEPAQPACGAPNCCAHCGRHAACREKTCQVVCDIKKEQKCYWTVECEEICPLLPGCRTKCPAPPRCGHPRSIKKLVKREYEVEVPVYKGVVKYLCGDCCGAEPAPLPATAPKTTAAPAPPAVPPAPPLPPPPTSRADVNDAPPKLVLTF